MKTGTLTFFFSSPLLSSVQILQIVDTQRIFLDLTDVEYEALKFCQIRLYNKLELYNELFIFIIWVLYEYANKIMYKHSIII